MEKRDRTLRAARLTMLLAALLAAGASFGLHPEPASGRGDDSPIVECSHSPSAAHDSHDCVACRAHRSSMSARAISAVAPPRPSAPSRPTAQTVLPTPGAPSRCDGRAPPSAA